MIEIAKVGGHYFPSSLIARISTEAGRFQLGMSEGSECKSISVSFPSLNVIQSVSHCTHQWLTSSQV